MTVTVSDHVDVCEMFEAEVTYATPWTGRPTVRIFSGSHTVMRWQASRKIEEWTSNCTTVWFDDNLWTSRPTKG